MGMRRHFVWVPDLVLKGAQMPNIPEVAGNSALAICESLLLAFNDRSIPPKREIVGVLNDAAATHTNAASLDREGEGEMHKAVAALINKILATGNSVRRK